MTQARVRGILKTDKKCKNQAKSSDRVPTLMLRHGITRHRFLDIAHKKKSTSAEKAIVGIVNHAE